MYFDIEEGKLADIELGDTVNVRVTGKVKGMRAKPEPPKKRDKECCDPMGDDDYYKYASMDITVKQIEIIEDNEFSQLDASMEETD